MRILHVIDSLIMAGAEALVKDSVPRMQDRGHDVTVAVLRELPESPFEQELRRRGIRFLRMPTEGIYSPRHLVRLASEIPKFDVVHARLFPAFLWVALSQILRNSGVPLVLSADAVTSNRDRLPFNRMFERLTYPGFSAIAAASEGIARHVRGIVPEMASAVRVIWNGIDLKRFRNPVKRIRFFENEDPVFVYTARFNPEKDHGKLIRALHMTEQGNLVLVGEGPLRKNAEQLANSLGLTNRIRFLGHRADVPEVLKSCDIYVHVPLFEGFGIAVTEAMASGLPVIAAKVSGLDEVVGPNGILVEPSDREVLAQAMKDLVASPAKREELSLKSLRRAEKFDIENTVNGYVDLYRELAPGA